MKKIAFLIVILVFFSCKKETKKVNIAIPEIHKTDSVVYSSTAINHFFKYNSEFSEHKIIGLSNPQKFTSKEITFSIKENDFNYNKSNAFDYFTVTTFDFEKITYKVIAYNSYGENDTKVLNVQLNSYQSGEQIDALLLDCRFTFETEYNRHFTIKNNGTITIKKLEIDGLQYSEEGDIIGKKTVKDTTSEVVQYKMNTTGHFIKS